MRRLAGESIPVNANHCSARPNALVELRAHCNRVLVELRARGVVVPSQFELDLLLSRLHVNATSGSSRCGT